MVTFHEAGDVLYFTSKDACLMVEGTKDQLVAARCIELFKDGSYTLSKIERISEMFFKCVVGTHKVSGSCKAQLVLSFELDVISLSALPITAIPREHHKALAKMTSEFAGKLDANFS